MCIFCERAALSKYDDSVDVENCEEFRKKGRVKCSVITGFLGAGKTTFLNYLLSHGSNGRKIAVLVNEFGSVPIDDKLLAGASSNKTNQTKASSSPADVERLITLPDDASSMKVVSLENGCVCCTVRGDMVQALLEFVKPKRPKAAEGLSEAQIEEAQVWAPGSLAPLIPDFDYLIVECSGASEIVPVAQTFYEPEVQREYVLDSILCVVDCQNYAKDVLGGAKGGHEDSAPYGHAEDGFVDNEDMVCVDVADEETGQKRSRRKLLLEQLGLADVVLVNKIDMVDRVTRTRVQEDIARRNSQCVAIPCRNGRVSIDQVLDVGRFQVTKDLLKQKPGHAFLLPRTSGGEQQFSAGLRSISLELTKPAGEGEKDEEPLDIVKFRSWFADLYMRYASNRIVRCKGIIWMQDGMLVYPVVIQGVGDHVEWEKIDENFSTKKSQLVVIFEDAKNLNEAVISEGFQKCRASVARAEREGLTPAQKMMMAAV